MPLPDELVGVVSFCEVCNRNDFNHNHPEMEAATVTVHLPQGDRTGSIIRQSQYPGEWIITLNKGDDNGHD